MRDRLFRVYAAFKDNGVADIKLQSALDVRVKECNYTMFPRYCLKPMKLGDEVTVTTSGNAASNSHMAHVKPIICQTRCNGWVYNKCKRRNVEQDSLLPNDLAALVVANYHAAITAGWKDKAANIVAPAHVMAVLLGALEPSGECRIVDDRYMNNLTAAELAFLNAAEEMAHSGSLICFMGAVNHFSINHTTGQGKLQDFALKVAKIIYLEYHTEHSFR